MRMGSKDQYFPQAQGVIWMQSQVGNSQPNLLSLEMRRWRFSENFNGLNLATFAPLIHQNETFISLVLLLT